jgi:hypothetical protein
MLVAHEVSKKALVIRDPDHCIDLGPKTLAGVPVLETLLNEAKQLLKFVKTDRINGILHTLMARGSIQHCPAVNIHPDTRMYLADETLASVIGQGPFILVVAGTEEYRLYHESRSSTGEYYLPLFVNI